MLDVCSICGVDTGFSCFLIKITTSISNYEMFKIFFGYIIFTMHLDIVC
jgi:hypothetical protein